MFRSTKHASAYDLFILCLLCGFIYCENGIPVMKEHPKSIVARRNDPATLNCAAAGADTIQWFHDGHPVISNKQHQRSHRIALPAGSLFFLRVTAGKKENDAGTYWCVAINSHGAVRSRNATLTIATLEDDFKVTERPKINVQSGESVILKCRAPKGVPVPLVKWKHDGGIKVNNSRVYTTGKGDLVFEEVIDTDRGIYICLAENVAGTRESSSTKLTVLSPPWFREKPGNITAIKGATIELLCNVQGSPAPTISWRRYDGQITLGRTHILSDQTLRIADLTAADTGEYLCEARNEAGLATAVGYVNVIVSPELKEKPHDSLKLVGKSVQLRCEVDSKSSPLIVWKLPGNDLPLHMIAGNNISRAIVSTAGSSLTIKDLNKDDSGNYLCWGISNSGGIAARASIMVVDALPPPLIGVRPKDLYLAVGETAIFPCEGVSEIVPHNVSWVYQEASHIPAKLVIPSNTVSILVTGTLKLKTVDFTNSGIYTCQINSDVGTIEAEALLKVHEGARIKSSYIEDSNTNPAPPTKPKIISVNSTSIEISWLPNSRVFQGNIKSYKVEYWRDPWPEWRLAREEVKGVASTIKSLLPNTAYLFSVRAINDLGEESFPSPWSDIVYTGKNENSIVNVQKMKEDFKRMNSPSVFLLSVNAAADSSVMVFWEIIENSDVPVDGVTVYVVDKTTTRAYTVLGTSSASYAVRDLPIDIYYTFFIVPFWKTIEGMPSNSYTIMTGKQELNLVPSGIVIDNFNSEVAIIKWDSSPSRQNVHQNILGYKILITHNGTTMEKQTKSNFLEMRITPEEYYSVKVAYITFTGIGPWSRPEIISLPTLSPKDISNRSNNLKNPPVVYAPLHPAWLLYLLLPVLVLILGVLLFYIKYTRRKPVPINVIEHSSGPTLYTDSSIRGGPHLINMYGEQKMWKPENDKDSSISSTRLLKPEHMVNEYAEPRIRHISDTTEPYATTALLAPSSPRVCQSSPSWRYGRCETDNSITVNWGAFLPPPPVCPPPTDALSQDGRGTCSSGTSASDSTPRRDYSSSSSHYDNAGSSEHYEHPCDSESEHTYDIYTPVSPQANFSEQTQNYYFVKTGSARKQPVSQFVRHAELPKNNTH